MATAFSLLSCKPIIVQGRRGQDRQENTQQRGNVPKIPLALGVCSECDCLREGAMCNLIYIYANEGEWTFCKFKAEYMSPALTYNSASSSNHNHEKLNSLRCLGAAHCWYESWCVAMGTQLHRFQQLPLFHD